MSVKSQFFKKLQARQSAPVPPNSMRQADIAEFQLRMELLQEQMDEWLAGTGLKVEEFSASVTDLLVKDGTFDISGIVLRYEDRSVTFMPIFLHGLGVTGCVEATFQNRQNVTLLGRLFMRAGSVSDWTFTLPGSSSRSGQIFNEGTFFGLILALLP